MRRRWRSSRGVVAAGVLLLVAVGHADPPATDGAEPRAGMARSPAASVDEARVRSELGRILAGDDFRNAGRRPGAASLATRVWLSLQRWSERQPPSVTWGVVVGCLVVLLGIGLHVAWSVRSTLRGHRGTGARTAASKRPSADEARQEAAAAAAEGDYAGAVRWLYLATLFALEQRGVCDYRGGAADWTVVQRCRGAPGVEGPLTELVTLFQGSRFGGHACGADDYARCQELHRDILATGPLCPEAGDGPARAPGAA